MDKLKFYFETYPDLDTIWVIPDGQVFKSLRDAEAAAAGGKVDEYTRAQVMDGVEPIDEAVTSLSLEDALALTDLSDKVKAKIIDLVNTEEKQTDSKAGEPDGDASGNEAKADEPDGDASGNEAKADEPGGDASGDEANDGASASKATKESADGGISYEGIDATDSAMELMVGYKIDPANVEGRGQGGRILKGDVEAYIEANGLSKPA
jgi:pyruvate/2-oxoglutarate dehydrogenase complex dihydrolipoamide acyltransferase (E2) component